MIVRRCVCVCVWCLEVSETKSRQTFEKQTNPFKKGGEEEKKA